MLCRKILTTNASEYINTLSDIFAEYMKYIAIAREIEAIELDTPPILSLSVPSITFVIGGEYDRETNSILITDKTSVDANTHEVFISSNEKPSRVSSTTVLTNTQSEHGVTYLSEKLLKKGLSSYTVSWFYDSREFNEDDGDELLDVPSFRYAMTKRFIKNKEFFNELNLLAPDTTDDGVVTLGIAEGQLNRLDASEVSCSPLSVTGSGFTATADKVIFSNSGLSIASVSATISRTALISPNSLIAEAEATKKFLLSTLKNSEHSFISESVPTDNNSVVSQGYVETFSNTLFPLAGTVLPLNTSVVGTDDHSICNNFALVEIMKLKAEETYAKLLKIKITGKDNSTLGELMEYLATKIEELKTNFVKMDECLAVNPNSIDEGCKIDCATLSLNDNNLMITKQKLKGFMICSFKCQEPV
jgi:hypothetical protein